MRICFYTYYKRLILDSTDTTVSVSSIVRNLFAMFNIASDHTSLPSVESHTANTCRLSGYDVPSRQHHPVLSPYRDHSKCIYPISTRLPHIRLGQRRVTAIPTNESVDSRPSSSGLGPTSHVPLTADQQVSGEGIRILGTV